MNKQNLPATLLKQLPPNILEKALKAVQTKTKLVWKSIYVNSLEEITSLEAKLREAKMKGSSTVCATCDECGSENIYLEYSCEKPLTLSEIKSNIKAALYPNTAGLRKNVEYYRNQLNEAQKRLKSMPQVTGDMEQIIDKLYNDIHKKK